MIQSYLKWSGGKRNALPHLLPVLNGIMSTQKISRLIEPFTGSATVALNLKAENYFLADSNPDLILSHIMATSDKYGDYLEEVSSLFNQGYEPYYSLRERFNDKNGGPAEQAALFLYLNKFGFNGLCRYNRSGKFNVSMGRSPRQNASTGKLAEIKLPPLDELESFRKLLGKADFVCQRFESTLKIAGPGDLVYCDPPYIPAGNSKFNYTPGGFGLDDHEMLKHLASLSPAPVVISNCANDRTRELYADADSYQEFPVRRQISCNSGTRKPVMECIAVYR